MNDGLMTDDDAVSDMQWKLRRGNMESAVVLNAGIGTYPDEMDIPAHDCIKPNAAPLPDNHIPDNPSPRGDKNICRNLWPNIPIR